MAGPLSRETVPVAAMVTAFERVPQTLATLARIRRCHPAPAQVLVHVDGNRQQTAAAVRAADPAAEVIVSAGRVGPGGGRNRLMTAARHPLVASFDDDSWPMDDDYFQRLVTLFERHAGAAVIGACLFHRGEARREARDVTLVRADFVGAGCAYRRDLYLAAGGYVPLPIAYGMEEVDLSLRLHAQGWQILHSEWLRVEHDTDLSHHAAPETTAASVANVALMSFLRYPAQLWPLGLLQYVKRLWWLARVGRHRGLLAGVLHTPRHLVRYRGYRRPLPSAAVRSFLRLRRRPGSVAA